MDHVARFEQGVRGDTARSQALDAARARAVTRPPDEAPPPASFDDFEIVRALGRGGMGTVYLARDRVLDREVAIKLLGDHARDDRARERFAREARALARIHHPNVVAAYRAGTVDGRPYLAQELIDGPRLDELPRPTPWSDVWRVALGLARALAAVHAHGVIHRDVKPSNVMLGAGGEVKLIDFGLATVRGELATPIDPTRPRRRARRITEDGTIIGTPKYIAPEIWDGGGASERSDVHAMGLVLYELLVGSLPHGHLVGPALAEGARQLVLPRLERTWCEAPGPFAELVDRCVRHQPDERPSSAEIAAELESSYVRPPDFAEPSGTFAIAHEPHAAEAPPATVCTDGETEAVSAVTLVEALGASR